MAQLKEIALSIWTYRLGRWVYVFLFFYAGVNKLLAPRTFAVVIEAFGLVPEDFIMPLAIGLPILEIIAAMGLFFDIRGSLGLVMGLLILFLSVVSYGLWIGLDIDCGCFGPGDPETEAFASLRPAFYRDVLLIPGIFCLYFWRLKRSFTPVSVMGLVKTITYRRKE